MDINQIRELLPDYIQGLLDGENARVVNEALQRSSLLSAEYNRLRSYYASLASLQQVRAPDDFLDKVHARIAAPPFFPSIREKFYKTFLDNIPLELAGLACTAVLVIIIFNPFRSREIHRELVETTLQETPQAGETEMKKEIDVAEHPQIAQHIPQNFSENHTKTITGKPAQSQIVNSSTADASVPLHDAPAPVLEQSADELHAMQAGAVALHETAEEPPPDLAALSPAPSSSADPAENESEIYAKRLFNTSDSIVHLNKVPRPVIDDVGLLALFIPPDPSPAKKAKLTNHAVARSLRPAKQEQADRGAGMGMEEENKIAAEAPPSYAQTTLALIESAVSTLNGTMTLLKDKPQTSNTKYYQISIPREQFPDLKRILEAEGRISDEKFSIETSQTTKIQFNLIISIE